VRALGHNKKGIPLPKSKGCPDGYLLVVEVGYTPTIPGSETNFAVHSG
jgi:hypothetical protein